MAKNLTFWIPSSRYRRAVRHALCSVPAKRIFPKKDFLEKEGGVYQDLLVIHGFVNSGSSVIGDLLAEYRDVTVCCGADPGVSGRCGKGGADFEFDLLRMYGGVMDLASAFGDSRPWGKFKLMNFIHVAESLHRKTDIPLYGEHFMALTHRFVDQLIEARWQTDAPLAECLPFEMQSMPPDDVPGMLNTLYAWRENVTEAYVMKNLSKDEYYRLAREYVTAVLQAIPSKRHLVVDLLFQATSSLDECEKFTGPFKMLAVYRDPRDVYAECANQCVAWTPYDVDAFIAWYRSRDVGELKSKKDPRLLTLSFESLVTDYADSVAKVEAFCGLTPSDHERPLSGFDPRKSVRNIGLWKRFPDQKIMDHLQKGLAEFCFEGDSVVRGI